MPKEYEAMRDNMAKENIKKGMSPAKALKKAKSEAAATYNTRHPGAPITGKSPTDYGLADAGGTSGQRDQSEITRRMD